MKKTIWLVLAILFTLAITACSNDTTNSGENPNNPQETVKYAAEFRGEWIRMDNGDRWYINGSSISVNGTGTFSAVTLEKKSENVAVATGANNTKYTLFGARIANANFSAQIVLLDDNGAGQKPPVKITNPKQPDLLPLVVQPNQQTGVISVQNQIPGDRLEIVPNSSDWKDIKVDITPGFGKEQNLGVIPLTRGDNFKVSVRTADAADDVTELYADLVPRDYIIELENIGRTNGDAGWELSWNDEDFLYVSGKTVEDYNNIAPGEKKQLTLRLASKPITTATKSKEIKAGIWHYDAKSHIPKEWEDTVSITFHNTPVSFKFSSEKQVQGIIKASKGKSYYFKTAKESSADYTTEVYVPWSNEDYTVAFLGATIEADSATKYSFAVDDQPPVNWSSFDMWDYLGKYKPANEYETTAPVLDLTAGVKSFMGYLASDSIDYYKVRLNNTPSEVKIYTVIFNANDAVSGTAPAAVTWGDGTTIQLPGQGNMVKTDRIFGGWNTNSSGTGANYDAGSSYKISGNITLYAKWIVSYTVTFDGNGAAVGTVPSPITAVSGAAIQLPDQGSLEKSGYAFCGWNIESSGAGTNYGAGSSYTNTVNITLYAEWKILYTVTFDKNTTDKGSMDANPNITTTTSTLDSLPIIPVRPGYKFTGWNTQADGSGTAFTAASLVTENMTVYAQWSENIVPGANLAAKLSWLRTNAESNCGYTVQVNANETFSGVQTLSYGNKTGINILLKSTDKRTVSYTGSNGLFLVSGGVTLILDNITLFGTSNNESLVKVNSGGMLIMLAGSVITGNNAERGNYYGGGVFVENGIFFMEGGKISGNKASLYGGGVYVGNGGTFTMNSGEISGNTPSINGGGVYVGNGGTFTMNGGEISGNTAGGSSSGGGGGVYVVNGGTFIMNDGEISGNTAVGVNGGRGGGVNVTNGGIINKTGGTIYGYTDGDVKSNVAKNSSDVIQSNQGHAVYAINRTFYLNHRETTAGPTVNLYLDENNRSGGWE
jgi:uncharacterized repeat protein (TIGR02543 family)